MNKNGLPGANALIASVMLSGFASYGSIRPTQAQDQTIETLTKQWMDYTVCWTGLNEGEPTAIVFDPRAEGRSLTGDRWYKVESQESLSKMIDWLKFNHLYYPHLWRIVGSDGQFFGYIYTGYRQFAMKLVDEKTMKVYGIPATLRGESR